MSAQSQERNPITVSIKLGAISADKELPLMKMLRKSILLSASIANGAALAESDVNYVLLSVQKGAVVHASYDSRAAGQGAMAEDAFEDMVLDLAEVPAGDLKLVADIEGSGALDADAVLSLTFWQKESV